MAMLKQMVQRDDIRRRRPRGRAHRSTD
jgi:hypothetical protein